LHVPEAEGCMLAQLALIRSACTEMAKSAEKQHLERKVEQTYVDADHHRLVFNGTIQYE